MFLFIKNVLSERIRLHVTNIRYVSKSSLEQSELNSLNCSSTCGTFMHSTFAWYPYGRFLDGEQLCFFFNKAQAFQSSLARTEPTSCLVAIFTTSELRTKDILFPVRTANGFIKHFSGRHLLKGSLSIHL